MSKSGVTSGIEHVRDTQMSEHPLERLDELREARDLIEWMIDQTVDECRKGLPVEVVDDIQGADGSTETRHSTRFVAVPWGKIGEALGISRQAAWNRFRWNS